MKTELDFKAQEFKALKFGLPFTVPINACSDTFSLPSYH